MPHNQVTLPAVQSAPTSAHAPNSSPPFSPLQNPGSSNTSQISLFSAIQRTHNGIQQLTANDGCSLNSFTSISPRSRRSSFSPGVIACVLENGALYEVKKMFCTWTEIQPSRLRFLCNLGLSSVHTDSQAPQSSQCNIAVVPEKITISWRATTR